MVLRRVLNQVVGHARQGAAEALHHGKLAARDRAEPLMRHGLLTALTSGSAKREQVLDRFWGDRLRQPQARGWLSPALFSKEAAQDSDRGKPPHAYDGDPDFAKGLSHHISGLHLKPANLADAGVPTYDIQKAAYFGARLDLVVTICLYLIEKDDAGLREKIRECSGSDRQILVTPASYRAWLVKTLQCVEELDCADVNWPDVWARVAVQVPDLDSIHFDAAADSIDLPYEPISP